MDKTTRLWLRSDQAIVRRDQKDTSDKSYPACHFAVQIRMKARSSYLCMQTKSEDFLDRLSRENARSLRTNLSRSFVDVSGKVAGYKNVRFHRSGIILPRKSYWCIDMDESMPFPHQFSSTVARTLTTPFMIPRQVVLRSSVKKSATAIIE